MWVIVIFFSLICMLYLFKFMKIYNYWKDKGVPYVNLIYCFHNFAALVFRTSSLSDNLQKIYRKYPEARYIGFYQYLQPVLLVRDPGLIKKMTIKDFDAFTDHNTFITEDTDRLFTKNLFIMSNKEGWHETRSKISRLFTGNRMRAMLILMQQCSDQFLNYLNKNDNTVTLEIYDVFTRYANDVMGRAFFGVTCDSYKDENNAYYLMVKDTASLHNLLGFQYIGYYFCPILMKILNLNVIKKSASNFFRNLIKESLKIRVENKIVRPDMINLLIDTNSKLGKIAADQTSKEDRKPKLTITEEDITAHSIVFFLAGFDAVSYFLAHISYDLAANSDVQTRVYNEIQDAAGRSDGNFTFEVLRSLKYLNNVMAESIRLHPPSDTLDRKSVKPYLIKAEKPGEKNLVLEKNSWVWMMSGCIHADDNYYPNSQKFDPDRFSNHDNTQCTYLPFGSGPRKCVGSRFVLLECKLLLVHLVMNYELLPVQERKPHGNKVWVTLRRRT